MRFSASETPRGSSLKDLFVAMEFCRGRFDAFADAEIPGDQCRCCFYFFGVARAAASMHFLPSSFYFKGSGSIVKIPQSVRKLAVEQRFCQK